MLRRVGKPPRADKRYIRRPGAYALLPLGKKFLLTGQFEEGFDIQLPGGGIDPGENTLHALHREVLEETGWRIARPRRLGAFRRFTFMPEYDLWADKLCHVYVAHPVGQIANPQESDHVTVVMSGTEAVEALGNDGDRHFMREYLARRRA
ncbi:MAG: NUDIX domain-containing protein [Pseudomonadota bacterium]